MQKSEIVECRKINKWNGKKSINIWKHNLKIYGENKKSTWINITSPDFLDNILEKERKLKEK